MTKASREGPRALEEQLERVAADSLLLDLAPAYHKAARPGAESLLRRAASITARSVAQLDDPKEMAAVAAALQLRSVDLIEFWEPLLAACKAGTSTAPLRDLRTAARIARALDERLGERKPGPARDAVINKVRGAAERLEAWLPARAPSANAATRYARGSFDEDEDEDGVPKVRPPPDPKARPARPEGPVRRILGWILTVLVVAAMGYGAWDVAQRQRPKPRDAAYFNALVFEVADKSLGDDAVVFTMVPAWLTHDRPSREADIAALRAHLEHEGRERAVFLDSKGGVLATVDVDGTITWQREALTAGELLSVGEVDRDPIGEAAPAPAPAGPEGTLVKPMTAEELRRASAPGSPRQGASTPSPAASQ